MVSLRTVGTAYPPMDDSSLPAADAAIDSPCGGRPRTPLEIVIVDSHCDRYGDFVEAAQAGTIGLHFCANGRSAVRLARRFRADAWLIASDLPDVSGFDLLDMLMPSVLQGAVDPLIAGARLSLDQVGEGRRTGVFIAADAYRLEDEQRALASGVAGYLVRPVTLDALEAASTRRTGDRLPHDGGPSATGTSTTPDSTHSATRSST